MAAQPRVPAGSGDGGRFAHKAVADRAAAPPSTPSQDRAPADPVTVSTIGGETTGEIEVGFCRMPDGTWVCDYDPSPIERYAFDLRSADPGYWGDPGAGGEPHAPGDVALWAGPIVADMLTSGECLPEGAGEAMRSVYKVWGEGESVGDLARYGVPYDYEPNSPEWAFKDKPAPSRHCLSGILAEMRAGRHYLSQRHGAGQIPLETVGISLYKLSHVTLACSLSLDETSMSRHIFDDRTVPTSEIDGDYFDGLFAGKDCRLLHTIMTEELDEGVTMLHFLRGGEFADDEDSGALALVLAMHDEEIYDTLAQPDQWSPRVLDHFREKVIKPDYPIDIMSAMGVAASRAHVDGGTGWQDVFHFWADTIESQIEMGERYAFGNLCDELDHGIGLGDIVKNLSELDRSGDRLLFKRFAELLPRWDD